LSQFSSIHLVVTVCRFHNAAEEIVVGHDIVPPVNDSVRLTVNEYRDRLYEVPFVYIQFTLAVLFTVNTMY